MHSHGDDDDDDDDHREMWEMHILYNFLCDKRSQKVAIA
jgi:hypothetical protein